MSATLRDHDALGTRQVWFDMGFVKAEPAHAGGPWMIYLTASTPRVDHEGERVLPEALREASQYFLDRGKVSFEHVTSENRHDPSILIGEPTGIRFTPDGRTLVEARLYPHQPAAQSVWNILQSGGKLGASIGGAVLEKQALTGQPTTVRRIFLNHLAITSWPINEDTNVQIEPFAEFAKALGTTTAAPLILEDLEGSRARGTPAFLARWRALASILRQTHGHAPAKAKQLALALLIQRGEARQAFTVQPPVTLEGVA